MPMCFEVGAEWTPDHAACSRHEDAERMWSGIFPRTGQVGSGYDVAVVEHALELSSHKRFSEKAARRAEREPVGDRIGEATRLRTDRFEAMVMLPVGKWARCLPVDEAVAGDLVIGDPVLFDRTGLDLDDRAESVDKWARLGNNASFFPRRVEPAESSPTKMPVPQRPDRRVDIAAFGEMENRHALSDYVSQV